MSDSALLVIDLLKDFIEPEGKLSIGDQGPVLAQRLEKLLFEARDKDMTVIYICDRHLPDDGEFEVFPRHCVQGSEGSEIVERLSPREGELVVPKRRYSAFFGTDLDLILREKGIDNILLAGVCTNICVLYTAADARNLGYRVKVIPECVASFDEEAHKWALKELEETLGVDIK